VCPSAEREPHSTALLHPPMGVRSHTNQGARPSERELPHSLDAGSNSQPVTLLYTLSSPALDWGSCIYPLLASQFPKYLKQDRGRGRRKWLLGTCFLSYRVAWGQLSPSPQLQAAASVCTGAAVSRSPCPPVAATQCSLRKTLRPKAYD
jgi:hypothetical protein